MPPEEVTTRAPGALLSRGVIRTVLLTSQGVLEPGTQTGVEPKFTETRGTSAIT